MDNLTTYLGGSSVAGGKIKETGTTHWHNTNLGATNETGFTALPGGYRDFDGTSSYVFNYIGKNGNWWMSTSLSTEYAWDLLIQDLNRGVFSSYDGKNNGFSVRCLRD